jgi:DNA-binding CsgD family transcriptional regulator
MGEVTNLPDRIAPRPRGRPQTRVGKAQRRHQVVTMLLAGASEADIARTLKITPAAVSKIVGQVLDAWESQEQASVEKVRTLQLARIDRLIRAHWNAAIGVRDDGTTTAPSVKATAEIRNLEALRARIAGTEAARRVEFSGSLGFSLEREEVERADQAWLNSGGPVLEGTATEIADAG